tara:strand:+ start:1219 stop:2172 length:954 start_codon:yes stop_codon:yes gene_type:complete
MGGNVFKDKTSSIKREYINPTLNKYFKEMIKVFPNKTALFSTKHMVPVGSVGKKAISGDIDLAIDYKSILDKDMSDASIKEWGIDHDLVTARYEKIAKRARTATHTQLRMKAFLLELAVYINQQAHNIYVDEKKVTNGNIFGLFPQYNSAGKKLDKGVQVDWMIGDMDWLTFSYYSSVYKGNVKGLHRTQLMAAMFNSINLTFNHINGVKDKETGEVFASNPVQAIKVLNNGFKFKQELTKTILEDYFELQTFLNNNLTAYKLNEVINIYFKILDSTRADIPEALHSQWISNQSKLGLTGRFLPDNSKLIKYAKLRG